jgi:hypothetical protein
VPGTKEAISSTTVIGVYDQLAPDCSTNNTALMASFL